MENQVEGEEIDEIAILHRIESEDGHIQIDFEESENRLVNNDIIYIGPIKNDLIGSVTLEGNQITYNQEYDQTNVEAGIGYTKINRTYQSELNTYIISNNDFTIDSRDARSEELNHYKDLFSSTSYVEIVTREGTVIQDISNLENPLEIDSIKLYEIEPQEYGFSISYFLDASPFNPYRAHENSGLFLSPEYERSIGGYFNYLAMLFQSAYTPTFVFENNEMINLIAGQ